MDLKPLFAGLEHVFCGPHAIEANAREALRNAQTAVDLPSDSIPLSQPFLDVMARADAHPICKLITELAFNWVPPKTSADPLYFEHSRSKVHVELLGPDGLIKSDRIRMGLYGMLPNAEYGIRTHPAEEIFIMLAGEVDWKRAEAPYLLHLPGGRSHHSSMMPHASRTREFAFFSVYAWHGDISTNQYVYEGIPAN